MKDFHVFIERQGEQIYMVKSYDRSLACCC